MLFACILKWVFFSLQILPKEVANSSLGDLIALLKAECSKVLDICAEESTHIFGGNALYLTGPGKKIEPMKFVVRAYQIPAGAENVMDDFAGRVIFKAHKSKL